MSALFPHLDTGKWAEIGIASMDTLWMLAASLPLTLLIGIPLGVLLYLTAPRGLHARPLLYAGLSLVVNLLRSVPFIILMIVLIPVTLKVMGTSLGVRGAILPLVIGAAPFYARLVETALREVDRGIVEATLAMGASTRQLVLRVLLPESLPGLIAGATVTRCHRLGRAGRSRLPRWLFALARRCRAGDGGGVIAACSAIANARRPAGGAVYPALKRRDHRVMVGVLNMVAYRFTGQGCDQRLDPGVLALVRQADQKIDIR